MVRSALLLVLTSVVSLFDGTVRAQNVTEQERQLLRALLDFSPDPCGPPYGKESDWHSETAESPVFEHAVALTTEALNADLPSSLLPQDRAAGALNKLQQLSAEVNASWPDENRFHFRLLSFSSALVVQMTLRTHARFFVFGIPEQDSGKPNRLWREVGSDDEFSEHDAPQSRLDLYALRRGPSENPRFIARFILSGCAGSVGVTYDAREWRPKETGELDQIIKQVGSFGLDDEVSGFPRIGELRTEGPRVTLPYCWFSRIDTWDNPSLCAVDTYDISTDKVRFVSRTYNRPDLVPIAKVIEYAQQRDYAAILGYCAYEWLARSLVRDIPPYIFADDLRVARKGSGKERVKLGYDPVYRFDVENRAGRWMVVGFSAE